MPMEKINCNECGATLDVDGATRYVTCRRCRACLEINRTESSIFTGVLGHAGRYTETMPEVLQFTDERTEAAAEVAGVVQQDTESQGLNWKGTTRGQVLSPQDEDRVEPSIFAVLERTEQQTEAMPEVLEFVEPGTEAVVAETPAAENPDAVTRETKSQRLDREWAMRKQAIHVPNKGANAGASATNIGLPLITAVGGYGIFWILMAFWIVNQNPASGSLGLMVALPLAVTAFTCVAIFYGLKTMRRQALAGDGNGNYISATTTSMGLLLIVTIGGYGVFWIVLAFWMANQTPTNTLPALIVILPLFVTAFTCIAIFRGLKMLADVEKHRELEEDCQRKRAVFLDRPDNTN